MMNALVGGPREATGYAGGRSDASSMSGPGQAPERALEAVERRMRDLHFDFFRLGSRLNSSADTIHETGQPAALAKASDGGPPITRGSIPAVFRMLEELEADAKALHTLAERFERV